MRWPVSKVDGGRGLGLDLDLAGLGLVLERTSLSVLIGVGVWKKWKNGYAFMLQLCTLMILIFGCNSGNVEVGR